MVTAVRTEETQRSGLIAINVAAIIFGTAALYGKLDISPFWIVMMRGTFASIAIATVGVLSGGLGLLPTIAQLRGLLVTGLVLAIHWVTFFLSVQLAGVAVATLTFAVFPLFTVLLVTMKARRRPSLLELGAGIAIILAVALLVDAKNSDAQLTGAIVGLGSALSFAVFGIKAQLLTTEIQPLMVSLIQNLTVALCLTPTLVLSSPAPHTTTDWVYLMLLGVVTTAFMHQLYLFALKRLSATTCSGFIALEPVYAIVFAAIFFGEPLTLWVVVSAALIIGASMVLLRAEQVTVVLD
ncbi:MAG: Putative EamA-like transporter [Nitrospira sp.]|nr:MAG: Putative EamA-like transporter [Nitrospira sp.]